MERSFGRLAEARAVVGRVAVAIDQHLGHDRLGFRGRRIGIDQILIANDQHALRQSRYFFIGALDSFDDQRAGRSAQHLRFAEAVNMRVIPVKPRRLICRDAETDTRKVGRRAGSRFSARRPDGRPGEWSGRGNGDWWKWRSLRRWCMGRLPCWPPDACAECCARWQLRVDSGRLDHFSDSE